MVNSYFNYLEAFKSCWESCKPGSIDGKTFLKSEKLQCEQHLETYQNRIKSLNKEDEHFIANSEFKAQAKNKARNLFEALLQVTPAESEIILSEGFSRSTKEFARMAREFDPEVSWEDIFQAGRNVWIANSLQFLMNKPIEVSPAIFAYSMLYPYTDNYLDDTTIPTFAKHEFSKRFRDRLEGKDICSCNSLEDKIFALVAKVESQFKRNEFPGVFQSLLAIHDAQTRSIQLTSNQVPDTETLLSICIDKGGTSVLADGYLINGSLSPDEEYFMYGFGVYLQFIDDLQDVASDRKDGVSTLFTKAAQMGKLECYWQKSLEFGKKLYGQLDCFHHSDYKSFGGLMDKSTRFMMIESVGKNSDFYRNEFIRETEKYCPIHFAFIKKRRKGINRLSVFNQLRSYIEEKEPEYVKMVG